MTENPQTMASWVYRMDATMTLTGDLKKMSGDYANVQTTHKEEAESRINRDGHDRYRCVQLWSRAQTQWIQSPMLQDV